MPNTPFQKQTYKEIRAVDWKVYQGDTSFDSRSPIDILAKELSILIWRGIDFHPRSLSPGYSHEEFLEKYMIYSDPPSIPPDDEILDDKKGSLVVVYKFSTPLRQALFYGTPGCVEVKSASGMDYAHSSVSDHALMTYSWSIKNRQEALTGLMDKVFHPMLDSYFGLSLPIGLSAKLHHVKSGRNNKLKTK